VADGIAESEDAANSCKFARPKRCKNACVVTKAQPTVATGKFVHELEVPEFHDEAALVGVEELVDFCLADRLLKGDAGEHFECRGRGS
jgi:hypothetical protein